MVRPAQYGKTLSGRSARGENAPKSQKSSDPCAKFDPEFLRGAVQTALRGGSIAQYADAYEGEATLLEPISAPKQEAPSKNE